MCLNKDSAGLIISLFKMNIDSMSLNISTWNIFSKTNMNNVIPALLGFE